MPNMKVLDMTGKEVGTVELADSVFAVTVNAAVLHAAVRAYLLNQRQGTQSTLTRTEVSGGGKKPWRQKGTGRARQGSTRSPQWTHGGVALGPKPRFYRTDLNKKVKRLAMKSAFSSKVADDSLVVVDAITATEFKTRTMVNMLSAVGASGKADSFARHRGCDPSVIRRIRGCDVFRGTGAVGAGNLSRVSAGCGVRFSP